MKFVASFHISCFLTLAFATCSAADAAEHVSMRFYRNLFPPTLEALAAFDRDGVAPDMSVMLPDFTLRDPWTRSRKESITRCYGVILDAWLTTPEKGEWRFAVADSGGKSRLFVGCDDGSLKELTIAQMSVTGSPEVAKNGKATPPKKVLATEPRIFAAGERVRIRAYFASGGTGRFSLGLAQKTNDGEGDDGTGAWGFSPIPAAWLSPAPVASSCSRLAAGNSAAPVLPDAEDDEPDALSWERFADEMPFVAHFLEWAATNPPPQNGSVSHGVGAQPVMPPADFPCLWARLADVQLIANQKIWCNTNFVKGAGCVALKGPPFHYYPGSSAAFDVEVAEEGDYRLWCRFWRPGPKSSGTFNVSLSESPSDNPAEDNIGVFTVALGQTFARTPSAPYRPLDPIPDIRSTSYPSDGWMWEASHRRAHLTPGRWRVTFRTGAYPEQPGAVVSDVVLTADPMLDFAAMPEAASGGPLADMNGARMGNGVVHGRLPASAASRNPLFAIRPGVGLAEASPARLAWWRRWRDALYDKLCDAEYTDYVWGYLASLNCFDEDSNLIGRVREVRSQKGYDAARSGASDVARVGDGDIAFWTQNPFGPFDRFSQPASKGHRNQNGSYSWTALPDEEINRLEHGVEAKMGEVKSRLLLIRNNTDAVKVIEPLMESSLPSSVRLVAYTVTAGGFWSPQILLKRRQVALPPRQNTALWVSIDCREATEGEYPVMLRFANQAVTWRVRVAGSIKDAPTPITYGWSRPYPRRSCWEAYRDHGLNAISYMGVSRRVLDEYGIRLLVGIPFDARNFTEENVAHIIERAARLGQKAGDYCWYLIDEPHEGHIPRWIKMAETLRRVDPAQLIWCNLGDDVIKPSQRDLYFKMMDYWDVACPFFWQFGRKSLFPEYHERLHTVGKIKLLYDTLDIWVTEKNLDAPQNIIGIAERSVKEERDGFANFTLATGAPYDDLYMDNQDNAVSIYPGAWSRTLSTRNFEAWREGVQRWRTARVGSAQ